MNARLLAAAAFIALASLGLARHAAAQDIEPRTYRTHRSA